MVVRHGDHLTAFCGGVDIIPGMTPRKWSTTPWHGWHDLQVQLDGPITRDLEKEFVARWNRERGASRRPPLPGWSPYERLTLTPLSKAEQIPGYTGPRCRCCARFRRAPAMRRRVRRDPP